MKKTRLIFLLLVITASARSGGCWPALEITNVTAKKYPLKALRDTIRIELNPTDSTIVFRLTKFDGDCNFYSGKWYKNNHPIAGNTECITAGIGTYTVSAENDYPYHFDITVIVTATATAIEPYLAPAFDFNLSPHPSLSGLFVIEQQFSTEPFLISIYDLHGRMIKIVRMSGNKMEIDISAFEKGIYIVELESAELKRRKKLVFN